MNTVQKAISGTLLIATIVVLTLPDRKTVEVLGAGFDGIRRLLGTAMTGKA